MYFTQDDYRKIEKWLQTRSIKDTQLQRVFSLKSGDLIPIIQDGQNKTILAPDILKESEAMIVSTEKVFAEKSEELRNEFNDIFNAYNTRLVNITNSIGKANGLASLDSTGRVPSTQLPSYVDDVVEVPIPEMLPSPGEGDKIYITKSENKIYRWGGTSYVEIPTSLAIGETSETAFAGSRGVSLENQVQSINHKIVNATPTSAGLMSATYAGLVDKLYNKRQDIGVLKSIALKNNSHEEAITLPLNTILYGNVAPYDIKIILSDSFTMHRSEDNQIQIDFNGVTSVNGQTGDIIIETGGGVVEQEEAIKTVSTITTGGLKTTSTKDNTKNIAYHNLLPKLLAKKSVLDSSGAYTNQEVFNSLRSGSPVLLSVSNGFNTEEVIGTAIKQNDLEGNSYIWAIIVETIEDDNYVKYMYPVEDITKAVDMTESNKIEILKIVT